MVSIPSLGAMGRRRSEHRQRQAPNRPPAHRWKSPRFMFIVPTFAMGTGSASSSRGRGARRGEAKRRTCEFGPRGFGSLGPTPCLACLKMVRSRRGSCSSENRREPWPAPDAPRCPHAPNGTSCPLGMPTSRRHSAQKDAGTTCAELPALADAGVPRADGCREKGATRLRVRRWTLVHAPIWKLTERMRWHGLCHE